VRQSKLYEEGNHNFQNSAREKLEKKGIYPAPGEDANSLYQQVLMEEGNHSFQIHAQQELKRRGREVLKGESALSLYQQVLMEEGNHNFQLFATKELKKRGREVLEGESAIGIYQQEHQQELMKEGDHNFQNHATRELKKRGRDVLKGENAISILKREQAKDGKLPIHNLTADQKKKKAKAISTGHAKEDSNASVKWEAQFTKFEAYPGMPTAKTSDEGVWLKAQRANLPKLAMKNEAWAKKLARMKKACIKKNGRF
jgi:hypothetical protein